MQAFGVSLNAAVADFGPVQASSSSSADLGPVQASAASSSNAGAGPVQAPAAVGGADPGLEQALRAVAEISSAAAADGVSVENALQRRAAEVSEALLGGERSETTLHNPWNLFQHEHRGKGWSPAQMSKMYKKMAKPS